MKERILLKVILGLLLMLGFSNNAQSQTVVFDEEIYWEHPPASYGGYGFYWWHRTEGSYNTPNYGDMSLTDWTSPDNYYNGSFELRFEVLEMPTTQTFYIQFGIWQDSYKGTAHPETVSSRSLITPGSVFSGNIGSPSTWWNKEPTDKVDFTRPEDFYRMGIVLFNNSPLCIPMGTEWNEDGCPENAYKYFPMRARVTVTASTSSAPPPTVDPPNYSVDYFNERTNKIVSTQDQYSYNASFSPAYSGSNTYLTLTPGQTVYFRKKADYTKKQTMSVPSRPSSPAFTIDYVNERTSTTVSSAYEFDSSSGMAGAVSGSGDYVYLTPETYTYFRVKATSSSFKSEVQSLSVPGRPLSPTVDIDYINERTSSTIGSYLEYSTRSDMSGAITGSGDYLPMPPGSDLYLRKKANTSAFSSLIQHLDAPGRSGTPAYVIDFVNERTIQPVPSTDEYALTPDMTGAQSGSGLQLGLEPGTNIYFRTKASPEGYGSDIQPLLVPNRPASPTVAIDFINETSFGPIGTDLAHSVNPDMNPEIPGDNQPLSLTPGINQYFRYLPGSNSFASHITSLAVVQRPMISSSEMGTTQLSPFLVTVNFMQNATNLTVTGIKAENATLGAVGLITSSPSLTSYQALVYGINDGMINLEIQANAVLEGNFKSLPYQVYFQKPFTGIQNPDHEEIFRLYPNPSSGKVHITTSLPGGTPVHLNLYSSTGKLVMQDEFIIQNGYVLNLDHLEEGIFILKLSSEEFHTSKKIFIQR